MMSDGQVWIVGAGGQLGRALRTAAAAPGRIRSLTSADVDITERDAVGAALANLGAHDVVINCAAHTDVDGAESAPDEAAAVNTDGPGLLAEATAAAGAWLIHLSTDYVFGGAAAGGASDTEQAAPTRTDAYEPADTDAGPGPDTVYGRTKLDGERRALTADPQTTVVRTAWVYTGGPDDRDFVGTMRRLEAARDTVDVVDDQVGSPTYVRDLADGLWELVAAGPRPQVTGAVLHATNAGRATWYEVARAVFAEVGADPQRVHPCGTEKFPRPAPRPAFSVLGRSSWTGAGLTALRDWSDALHAAIAAASPIR